MKSEKNGIFVEANNGIASSEICNKSAAVLK